MSSHTIIADKVHIQRKSGSQSQAGQHGEFIDFIVDAPVSFNKDIATDATIRSDLYATKSGDIWVLPSTNTIQFQKNVDFQNHTLSNIAGLTLTASQVQSSNYNGQTLDHELDQLTTAQNTLTGRTQGLTANRMMLSNNAGILATGSLLENNINTLSGNQTVTGNKTLSGDITIDDLTASRLVLTDGSKKLVSGIAENTINTLAGNQTISGNKIHSGDITINDLTASKLVLTDSNKKIVSGIAEADLFKLNVASNQYQGESGVATVYSQTQSSNASDSQNYIRMIQGTSSPKEMGLQLTGATQSINFTDTLNLKDLGDGDNGTTIGQIKNNGINIISGKNYQINGSNLNFSNLAGSVADNQVSSNIVKLDTSENNFTGIVDGASFKQGNSALNFSHLAGAVADSQLSSNIPLKNADTFQTKAGALTNTMRTVSDTTGHNSKLTFSKILANGNAVYENFVSSLNTGQMVYQTSTATGHRWNIDDDTQYLKLSKTILDLKAGMLLTIGGSQITTANLANEDNIFHDDDNFVATGQITFSNRLQVGLGDDSATTTRGIYYGTHTFTHGIDMWGETNITRQNPFATAGNLNIQGGSKLKLKNLSDLEVESGADLIVKSGGDILIDSGGVLTNNGTTALVGTSAITGNMTISNSADFITSSGSQTTILSGGILELADGGITKLGTNSITKINNALPSVSNSSIKYDTAGKPAFIKGFHGEQYLRSVFPASLLSTTQSFRMRFDVIPIENASSVISSNYRQSVTTDTHNSLQPFADDGSARDARHQIAPTYNITRDGVFASSSLISEVNLVFNDGHISGSNDHKSVFIKGCGYINWLNSGWGSHINGATNKFVRLGVKCSETVRVLADGQLVGSVNRTGGDSHQGIGSSSSSAFQYLMFPAKGDYTTIEIVMFNFTNSLKLDFEVYPISYWNDP